MKKRKKRKVRISFRFSRCYRSSKLTTVRDPRDLQRLEKKVTPQAITCSGEADSTSPEERKRGLDHQSRFTKAHSPRALYRSHMFTRHSRSSTISIFLLGRYFPHPHQSITPNPCHTPPIRPPLHTPKLSATPHTPCPILFEQSPPNQSRQKHRNWCTHTHTRAKPISGCGPHLSSGLKAY